jgi:hypothetical protein
MGMLEQAPGWKVALGAPRSRVMVEGLRDRTGKIARRSLKLMLAGAESIRRSACKR